MKKKIKVFEDGNMVCVLWGENLQVGVCGFGRYISEAFEDFVKDFLKQFLELDKNFLPEEIINMYDFLQHQFEATDEWNNFYKDKDIWQEHQKIYFDLKNNL